MTVVPRETRFKLPEGWHFEISSLTFGRGRIMATDGFSVEDFW